MTDRILLICATIRASSWSDPPSGLPSCRTWNEDKNRNYTRVDKVKPKGWFKYSLSIDKRNIVGLFHIDINLVLPKMIMSIMDAGILITMQQVKLMIFSLNMVYYPMSFLLLST